DEMSATNTTLRVATRKNASIKVSAVMDTKLCNTAAPDYYAARPGFRVSNLHYVNEAERTTSCFVAAGLRRSGGSVPMWCRA
ncbi:hypothetical protein, partial [Nocardia xishanensis]|uniref:hypothetical protein n=1 Tax=Nocardia xishanensis TaxID=238964 RepID=UPI000A4DEA15